MKATVVNNLLNNTQVVELPEAIQNVASLRRFLNLDDESKIFEGNTRTDLISNDASLPILPSDRAERGYVFFVTPSQNKMFNGIYSRKECYDIIKQQGYAAEVISRYGRNFTQVPTASLNELIAGHQTAAVPLEKEIFQTISSLLQERGAEVAELNALIDKVFSAPYSVQDLANLNK